MHIFITTLFVVAGIIHILPLTGVMGSTQLAALYGMQIEDRNLLILMRHRAVLFALLGIFLLYSGFKPQFQTIAIIAGWISTVSFLWLALSVGDYNDRLNRVVVADVIALACLIAAAGLKNIQPGA